MVIYSKLNLNLRAADEDLGPEAINEESEKWERFYFLIERDTIRQVLKKLCKSGQDECLSRGQNARWQKKTK